MTRTMVARPTKLGADGGYTFHRVVHIALHRKGYLQVNAPMRDVLESMYASPAYDKLVRGLKVVHVPALDEVYDDPVAVPSGGDDLDCPSCRPDDRYRGMAADKAAALLTWRS